MGVLELRAPKWMTLSQIDQWLEDQKNEINKYLASLPPLDFLKSGSTIYYLGEEKNLVLRPDIVRAYIVDNTIQCPEVDTVKHLENLYKKQAKVFLQQRFDQQWSRVIDWNIKKPSMHVRKMKTRWGSCSSLGRINLSLGLMAKPVSCIDYVICHEISHLREFNHSARFYAVQSSLVNDWKEQKTKLETSPDNLSLLNF
jgi:predicted metal-dependent hydrolase